MGPLWPQLRFGFRRGQPRVTGHQTTSCCLEVCSRLPYANKTHRSPIEQSLLYLYAQKCVTQTATETATCQKCDTCFLQSCILLSMNASHVPALATLMYPAGRQQQVDLLFEQTWRPSPLLNSQSYPLYCAPYSSYSTGNLSCS